MLKEINSDRQPTLLYKIAPLSYSPWIGAIIGVLLIKWSLRFSSKDRIQLSALGLGGILLNLLYSYLLYKGLSQKQVFNTDNIWTSIFLYNAINGFFWATNIVTIGLFYSIKSSIKRRVSAFPLHGLLWGLLIWLSIDFPIGLEDNFGIFGCFSGEAGWGVIMLYMFGFPIFTIGGLLIGLARQKRIQGKP